MTCLQHILHVLTTNASVTIPARTLKSRARADLQTLRPDLPFPKQLAHWADIHSLIPRHDPVTDHYTFTRL